MPSLLGAVQGQRKYSDLAIESALTLRQLFKLPLRQVEGLLRSLSDLMGLALDVPDHTTLSRRAKKLNVPQRPASAKVCGRPSSMVEDLSGLAQALLEAVARHQTALM